MFIVLISMFITTMLVYISNFSCLKVILHLKVCAFISNKPCWFIRIQKSWIICKIKACDLKKIEKRSFRAFNKFLKTNYWSFQSIPYSSTWFEIIPRRRWKLSSQKFSTISINFFNIYHNFYGMSLVISKNGLGYVVVPSAIIAVWNDYLMI